MDKLKLVPLISANPPIKVKIETVGPPIKGVEVKLSDEGELLVKVKE